VALLSRDIQLRLSQWGLLGSPYSQYQTLWLARGGPQCLETIRAQADLGNSAVPSTVGRPGGEGFWVRDYWGGGAGRGGGAFWRTPNWPRKRSSRLGPVTFGLWSKVFPEYLRAPLAGLYVLC
jgi:hypothetical protein